MANVKKQTRNTGKLIAFFTLLLAILLTVFTLQQSQSVRQFAQQTLNAPPTFFCIALGQSDSNNCGTLSFKPQVTTEIKINGKPISDPTKVQKVYYKDIVTGNTSYTNTGDLPIQIKSMGLVATHKKRNYRVHFTPKKENITLQPGQTVTLASASHEFNAPDPGGITAIQSTLTNAGGQTLDSEDQVVLLNVDTTCRALAATGTLTEKDLEALRTACKNKPEGPACKACKEFHTDNPGTCTQEPKPKDQPANNPAPANPGGGNTTPQSPLDGSACTKVGGSCGARSACTGKIQTGLCPGDANNICCIGTRDDNYRGSDCLYEGQSVGSGDRCCGGNNPVKEGNDYICRGGIPRP